MATTSSACSKGYWQKATLTFADGAVLEAVLDLPTLKRLEDGDNELMNTIRRNLMASKGSPTTMMSVSSDCNTIKCTSALSPQSVDLDTSHSESTNNECTSALSPQSVDLDTSHSESTNNECTSALSPQSVDLDTSHSESTNKGSSVDHPKFWSKADTKFLMTLRAEREKDFSSSKTHKILWQKIAEEISSQGKLCTGKQCENKFKSLKREYRATVDHNSRSGNEPKTCMFFIEFNELYGMCASSKPSATVSSLEENVQQPTTESSHPKKRKASSTWTSHDWMERQVAMQQERHQDLKEMHNQKMAIMERLLSVLEKKSD